MKILIILNYYFPYISGVSEYARLLAEKMVDKGYDVTVLTSNHAKLLSREEMNGVNVVRASIVGKISKGTISPQFISLAVKMAKEADVVNMHLPMIESGIVASFIPSDKLVVTYHCDIHLPDNFFNKFIIRMMDWSNHICLKKSARIMVQTKEYSEHSRVAAEYKEKFVECATPIKEYHRCKATRKEKRLVIGFCGRIVEEKGLDDLIRAFVIIKKRYPDALLKIGGDYQGVAGGSVYTDLCKIVKENNLKDVIFLGKISDDDMEAFYSGLDVFVLPSVNSLEAFGMVQIEAMYCGIPVVASDLLGVRTIVMRTGMGCIAKRRNVDDLAEKIMEVLCNQEKYVKSRETIKLLYGTDVCLKKYEEVFEMLRKEK